MPISKAVIIDRMQKGELIFSPNLDKFQLRQHSIDLRLGFSFLLPEVAEMKNEGRVALRIDHLNFSESNNKLKLIELEEGQIFDVLPGEYIIVSTLEAVHLPNDLMAVLYPRSSVNRRGLSVDLTGIVDAGFEGNLMIPVRNNTMHQVIRLYPGERFCQLVFENVDGPVEVEKSRWHKKDANITLQKERSEDEIDFVKKGDIARMKKLFPV